MRYFHHTMQKEYCPTINVDKVFALLPEDVQAKAKAEAAAGNAPVVNVVDFGFFKVLGNGRLPDFPLVVKAKYFSKGAEAKIKAAGGAALLTA